MGKGSTNNKEKKPSCWGWPLWFSQFFTKNEQSEPTPGKEEVTHSKYSQYIIDNPMLLSFKILAFLFYKHSKLQAFCDHIKAKK